MTCLIATNLGQFPVTIFVHHTFQSKKLKPKEFRDKPLVKLHISFDFVESEVLGLWLSSDSCLKPVWVHHWGCSDAGLHSLAFHHKDNLFERLWKTRFSTFEVKILGSVDILGDRLCVHLERVRVGRVPRDNHIVPLVIIQRVFAVPLQQTRPIPQVKDVVDEAGREEEEQTNTLDPLLQSAHRIMKQILNL